MSHIRFQAPELPSLAEAQRYWQASEAVRWFSNGGPCLGELVSRIEEYVGRGLHAVPVSSATIGLMVALRAVTPADEGRRRHVVVPSYTFAATAAIIHWAGFKPLFVDVDPVEWHADPESVETVLLEHDGDVAAAVLCATYGSAPSRATTDAWERLCTAHGVGLVVDSAAGFGSRDMAGDLLGTLGDLEVFSFHATKPFAIGEGGVVLTRDAGMADQVRRLCNFGFNDARLVEGQIGVNGKMDELHAALALCVLDRYDEIVAARQGYAQRLRETLEPRGFRFQRGGSTSAHQFLPMLCASREERDALIARAASCDIELRAYFADPLHTMPAFRDDALSDLKVTEDLASRIVCLPVYNAMPDSVLARLVEVCEAADEVGSS
jgi:dTDP-4-amino-4,6-dideoxygalactose transaminase